MLWLFEEKLKQRYSAFVNVVQGYLKHSVGAAEVRGRDLCSFAY